jgi:hypothetical protein
VSAANPTHYRDFFPARAPELLIPQCDRCGRHMPLEYLTHDGLGHVCPGCRAGGQTMTEVPA